VIDAAAGGMTVGVAGGITGVATGAGNVRLDAAELTLNAPVTATASGHVAVRASGSVLQAAAGDINSNGGDIDVALVATHPKGTFARLPRARPEDDSVNEMVDELLAFVRPEAQKRDVALEAAPDPLIPLFSFDRDLLRRAVLNLLKNAIEATPRRGRVRLATRLCDGRVEVAVADSGAGIDARHASHLFEPFYTTKPRGTGLGLAIARQIAEEHGGTLTWENAREGGARFVLHIPLGTLGAGAPSAAVQAASAAPSGGARS